MPVILDAKRGDIGATAEQYAREAFERYRADALTLSPFMGFDSIEPYLRYDDKGLILLCRTSNPGGSDLQAQVLDGGEMLYEHIARLAGGPWNAGGQLGLVVGATYPGEVARVRELAPTLPLLIPGIGAQGGDAAATVRAGWRAGAPIVVAVRRAPCSMRRPGPTSPTPPAASRRPRACSCSRARRELIPPGWENEAARACPWRQTCRLAQDVGEDPTGPEARTGPITPALIVVAEAQRAVRYIISRHFFGTAAVVALLAALVFTVLPTGAMPGCALAAGAGLLRAGRTGRSLVRAGAARTEDRVALVVIASIAVITLAVTCSTGDRRGRHGLLGLMGCVVCAIAGPRLACRWRARRRWCWAWRAQVRRWLPSAIRGVERKPGPAHALST